MFLINFYSILHFMIRTFNYFKVLIISYEKNFLGNISIDLLLMYKSLQKTFLHGVNHPGIDCCAFPAITVTVK